MQTTENTSSLRGRIDSGRTGDKVDFPDPAAAPLGSDAEAGGKSPTDVQIATDVAAQPSLARLIEWADRAGVAVYAAVGGAVSLAILLIVGVSG